MAFGGLHQKVGFGVARAALFAAPAMHVFMDSPELRRVLALVAETGFFLEGPSVGDGEVRSGAPISGPGGLKVALDRHGCGICPVLVTV